MLESEIPDQKPILHISLGPLIGPSATKVDLTVVGVVSNICRHTGITRLVLRAILTLQQPT